MIKKSSKIWQKFFSDYNNIVIIFYYVVEIMTEQEIKLQEFKALDADKKKEKLLAIFEFAKDKFDFSENAINYLSSDTEPSELVMENFYEFVVDATFIAKDRIEKQQVHRDEEKKNLQAREKVEARKDAEDADVLLDLFNLL